MHRHDRHASLVIRTVIVVLTLSYFHFPSLGKADNDVNVTRYWSTV